MVNPASATSWEVRAASSPGHSWQSVTQADAAGLVCSTAFQVTAPAGCFCRAQGRAVCGPQESHQPGGWLWLPSDRQAPHHRGNMMAQQALPVGPVPMTPLWEGVGNEELPPQVGGQRGEADG